MARRSWNLCSSFANEDKTSQGEELQDEGGGDWTGDHYTKWSSVDEGGLLFCG